MRSRTAQRALLVLAMASCRALPALAQAPLPPIDDKTGTNPLNLQQTVWVWNEFASLPDALFVNRTVYRWSAPFAGRRVAVAADLPIVAANVTGRTEMAFGDLGATVMWTPWLSSSRGLLVGADTTWSTATNDALGAGRHTVAPYAQVVFTGSGRTILAPRYGHRFSAGGDASATEVNEGTLGVYAAWLPTPRLWLAVEPEVVFDVERDETRGSVATEYGTLLLDTVGTYVRPRIGLGSVSARPYDWSIEFGFRIIP